MKLGFLGAGNIGTAIITGLCTGTAPPKKILVYDPDKQKCAALEQRFDQVETATESQSLLDNVDCVFLCVLPQIAPQVLLPLNFRQEHTISQKLDTGIFRGLVGKPDLGSDLPAPRNL